MYVGIIVDQMKYITYTMYKLKYVPSSTYVHVCNTIKVWQKYIL